MYIRGDFASRQRTSLVACRIPAPSLMVANFETGAPGAEVALGSPERPPVTTFSTARGDVRCLADEPHPLPLGGSHGIGRKPPPSSRTARASARYLAGTSSPQNHVNDAPAAEHEAPARSMLRHQKTTEVLNRRHSGTPEFPRDVTDSSQRRVSCPFRISGAELRSLADADLTVSSCADVGFR